MKLLGEIGIELGPAVFEHATWPILFPVAFLINDGCRLNKKRVNNVRKRGKVKINFVIVSKIIIPVHVCYSLNKL